MMTWAAVAFLVLGFLAFLRLFKLVPRGLEAIALSKRSLAIVRDDSLDLEIKEQELQKNSLHMLRLFVILTGGAAVALLLPYGAVWLVDRAGWVSIDDVMARAVSMPVLIGGSLLTLLALFSGKKGECNESSYSGLDRCVHRIAFHTVPAQIAIADGEDAMFRKRLEQVSTDRPVFITGLPRAGTTLVLECCAGLQDMASHCYRDMPYVLTPCLWDQLSQPFRKNLEKRQRAHGDGMEIDLDSPEALEEAIWMPFWKEQYQADRIQTWPVKEHSEFKEFFQHHMRKIVWLRSQAGTARSRYLSKNNLNIARIPWLRQHFPDSIILVPFRDPLQHVGSLLHQHQRFQQMHKEDKFSRDYMKAIGHFDFGENLKPVDFDGWLAQREERDATQPAFWLDYWIATYEHLLATYEAQNIAFIDFETLCKDPERSLVKLSEVIETQHPDQLQELASGIRIPKQRDLESSLTSESQAYDLHNRLRAVAINKPPR
ncbi:MAG: sulfotransferase [Haloferula sp.]